MVEPVELKTERLLLRPWRLTDVDDVLEFAADPEYARYTTTPQPYTRRDAEEWVARCVLASFETAPYFAIVNGERVVGAISLTVNLQQLMAVLHYGLARSHWGQGLMVEAASALVSWAFETYGLAKVYSNADVRNRQSWRVMEKLGMTREGLFRKHRRIKGEQVDDVYYRLLHEEWEASKGRLVKAD